MRLILSTLALSAALAASAWAQTSPIELSHAWSRPTPASASNGVIYVTIANHGADDQLTGVASTVADKTEMHTTLDENGVMKMRPLPVLPVKGGDSAEFKPGGMHIMLIGLKQPLKVGDSFPLTMTFEKAGAVVTTVTVEPNGAAGHDGMKMH
ncbi:MAG TPA: copper chaperone PCu(A)C [Aliidongia sp.]|nr:copper chaperone PCu(A)C [Aliidongia sp.]